MAFVESTATLTVDIQAEGANCYQSLSPRQRMVKSSRNHQRPALLVIVNLLAFVLTVAEGAPSSTTTAALPAPPTSGGSGMLNDYPDVDWRRTQTEPNSRTISFFKTPKCNLHQEGDRNSEPMTTKVVCGLRELDLPESAGSGVRFWTPSRCQRHNCQCIATREERRQKRTMADNKVDITYKRFRVFECV